MSIEAPYSVNCRYSSGGTDRHGRITRSGDGMMRTLLFGAGRSHLTSFHGESDLKTWGEAIAERRGKMRANVAVARKLAVILHRMWMDGTEFRYTLASQH